MERSALINGTLGCFCDQEYAEKGYPAMFSNYHRTMGLKSGPSGPICKDYFLSK